MDTTTAPKPVTAAATLPAPFPGDDPRAVFARAVALGGAVIAGVRPDQYGGPTPCSDFDVQALVGHLVGVLQRVAVVGAAGDALSIPLVVEPPADGDWVGAWRRAAHDVQAAWSDDAVLGVTIHLPWADAPGAAVLGMYTSEVTVHTWDLARATGQQPVWDDAVVAAADAAIRVALPDAQRELPVPFADAVPIDAYAPRIDRLVAWNGRRP